MMNVTKIADSLAESLPTRDDVIKAIGLASPPSGAAELASALGIFGAGVLVGAGLTLLFAPQSGAELRRDLSERLSSLREQQPRNLRSAAPSQRTAVHPG